MNRLVGYLIAFVTAAMSYWIFYIGASFFGAANPHFIASAILATLIVHETAHLIVMEANKIPAKIIFLVILGGASPLSGNEPKLEKLPWERQVVIILAGVIGNFAIIIGSYVLSQFNYLSPGDFMKILNMNGVLILWNLIPISFFDGGKFTKLLFDSISEDRDSKFAIGLAIGFICAVAVMTIITGNSNFFFVSFFLWNIHSRSKNDDPYGSENPKAIPRSHQKWWAALYLLMIVIAVVITFATPSWLQV